MNEFKNLKITCPRCKSLNYKYVGELKNKKHEFECYSCNSVWQYRDLQNLFEKSLTLN